jgi:hypothetical protein
MDGSRLWRLSTDIILARRCREGAIHPISLNFCFRPKATLSVAVLAVADWSSPVISRHLFAGILPPIAELRPPPEAVIQSMSVKQELAPLTRQRKQGITTHRE